MWGPISEPEIGQVLEAARDLLPGFLEVMSREEFKTCLTEIKSTLSHPAHKPLDDLERFSRGVLKPGGHPRDFLNAIQEVIRTVHRAISVSPSPLQREEKRKESPGRDKGRGKLMGPRKREKARLRTGTKNRVRGISLREAAKVINEDHENDAPKFKKKWLNKKKPKLPPSIGKSLEHSQTDLYEPSALLDFLEKIGDARPADKPKLLKKFGLRTEPGQRGK